jgi:cytoskeleton protein RodZ
MSKVVGVPDELVADLQIDKSPAVTIKPGALLRSAREAQGLDIAALAVTLKIPVKKLEALESDRFDLLPGTVFVRALALSVCRALKLDAAAVMDVMPQLQAPAIKTDEVGLNASFKSTSSGFKIASVMQGMKPAVFVMLALVVAIVVVFFWPAKAVRESKVPDAGTPDSALVAGPTQAGPGASVHLDAASQANQVQAVKLSDIAPASPPAALASATDTVSAGAAAPASSVAVVSSTVPASILTLQAHGQSWIDVTDALGNSQLRKTMTAGQVLQVSGALPLSVVLGRADAVTVLVRGKPLDVTVVSKDNVARFEVK